jgi:hypothetical protein
MADADAPTGTQAAPEADSHRLAGTEPQKCAGPGSTGAQEWRERGSVVTPIDGADFIPAAFLAPRRLIAWGVAVIEAAVIAWEDAHDCWGEEEQEWTS